MNRTASAIAALCFVAGALTLFIAQQAVRLFVSLPAREIAPNLIAVKESYPDSRRACTLRAAEALPKISGLTIKSSRTAELPPSANWTGTPPIGVELDIEAAGQKETYAYLCGDGPSGAVIVRLAK